MLSTLCQTSDTQLYAEWSVMVEQQLRDDMWWLHVWTTSGLTGQEADEAELNNYLQAQECAIFTGYSSVQYNYL